MIKITEISNPIVDDVWKTKSNAGEVVSHRIMVGHPRPEKEDDEESDWYCPVMIEGFLTRIVPAMGVGPVDSLMNALQLVKAFFDKHKDDFTEVKSEKC